MKHNALQKIVAKAMTIRGNGFSIVSSNRRGRPDIIGHIGMIGLMVEVKVGRDKLSPTQRATLLDITGKGGLGIVVHEKHLEVFERYLDKIISDIDKCIPCTKVGLPIPKELKVEPFKVATSFNAEAI